MNAIPYIFFVIICFMTHYYSNSAVLLKRANDVFIFVILILFFGFRGYVFTDYLVYKPWFENILSDVTIIVGHNTWPWFEKGFVLYSSIIKYFTEDYLIYQLIDGIVDVLLLSACLKYFEARRPINIMIFLAMSGMVMFFDTLRNSKAILIFFYSLRYINDRKPLRYYLCCLLAFYFHSSGIIYFLCYPILRRKINRNWYIIFCILSFFMGLFSSLFLKLLLLPLRYVLPLHFAELIQTYVLKASDYSTSRFISFGVIEKFLSLILVIVNFEKLQKDKQTYLLIKVFLLYFCSYFILSGLKEISNRISMLFICSYWVLIPRIISVQKKNNQGIYAICILFYCVLKMGLYSKPLQAYENWLFGSISSFEQRKQIIEQTYHE